MLIWNYWLLLSVYLHNQIIEAQCKKQMNLGEEVVSSKRDYFVLIRYASTFRLSQFSESRDRKIWRFRDTLSYIANLRSGRVI